MMFHVYRSREDANKFLVTDTDNVRGLATRLSTMDKVGEFPEMGANRVAFSEKLAKGAIKSQGFYEFSRKGSSVLGVPG